MHYCHLVLGQRERFHNLFITQFKVLVIQFLALKDERVNNERLASLCYLIPDEIVHGVPLPFPHTDGCDGFSPGRHLIYHGHVQVSIKSHSKCARNGCCGHNQNVRWNAVVALAPEAGALVHAKAMLLVNDGKPQGLELDGIFNEGMSADKHSHASVLQPRVDTPPRRRSGRSGKEFHTHAGGPEVL